MLAVSKSTTLGVLVAVWLAELVLAHPRPGASGFAVPLVKRYSLYGRDGIADRPVADISAIERHVASVDAKYRQGMLNWQTNTGELDLWPVANASESANPTVALGASPSTRAGLLDYLLAAQPSPSAHTGKVFDASVHPKIFHTADVHDKIPIPASSPTSRSPNQSNIRKRAQQAKKKLKTRQSAPLMDVSNDLLWVGMVAIGSSGQSFVVDMDTGSADFWVPHAQCSGDACKNHRRYDPTASTSSELQPGERFKITYGDGSSSSGPVYTDAVTVAGITADDQYFSAVTTVSDKFANDPEDGIMGMAFQGISELNQPPWFENLVGQNKMQQPVFSFRLAKQGSELYIGGTNTAKYTGPIEWHSLTSRSYWLIQGQPMIDGKPLGSKVYNFAIDTGTTVIVAPIKDAKAFWKNVPGSAPYAAAPSYYTFPCKTAPTISFVFTGSTRSWTISPQDFNLGQVASGSPNCVGALIGQDVGVNAWILGDAFLKNVYSVFDLGQSRVGFATPK